MESILVSIRQALGIPEDYSGFDHEIIVAINSAIMALSQLGVGPVGGLIITGTNEKWADLYAPATNVEAVKSYILLKTKLEFDPPTTSFHLEAINRQLEELAWRIMVQVDPVIPEV